MVTPQEFTMGWGESKEINGMKKNVLCSTSEKKLFALVLIMSEKSVMFKL